MFSKMKYGNFIRRFKLFSPKKIQKKQEYDLIGPPNPVTNLCPIKFAVRENETKLEKNLRLKREEIQLWNQEFWTNHHMRFIKEKEEYANMLKDKKNSQQSLTADEMSVFYKDFLDKNWKNHLYYNISWYKKNIYVTALEYRVRLERIFNIFR